MTWEAWLTLALVVAMVAAMLRNIAPDVVLMAGLTVLLAFGVLTPKEAFSGFANAGMLTVAALFVVAAGVEHTGALDAPVRQLLGHPRSAVAAQARLMVPMTIASAFLANTPLVAMMIPIVSDWSRRIQVSKAKLFMPMSFAAIVGGTCTLIGTTTNLVVLGMARDAVPDTTIGFFGVGVLGVPAAIGALLYMLIASRWLLPDRGQRPAAADAAREYTVAMRVAPGSAIVGRTIEAAGLRHLPGLFLIEIERTNGEVRPAPNPTVRLQDGDRLVFAGVVDSVVDLQRIRGLVPAEDQVNKLQEPRPNRCLVEAVVATASPLTKVNIRDLGFRTRYGAAIIAIQRQGERLRSRIGDIKLEPGDTLLLETHPSFVSRYGEDRAFALVREIANSAPRRHDRAWIALGLLAAMVTASALGFIDILPAALLTAGGMLVTRCLTVEQARRSLELDVLITIASAFAIGAALTKSGAAGVLGTHLVEVVLPFGPLALLVAVYIATVLLSAIVTSKASVVLIFPIAHAATQQAGIDFMAFVYVLMLAASGNFLTPISYQTNLMVYGPGGYRFTDFVRFGLPLQLVVGTVALLTASMLWL
jgi:di/tricarboxylate transporter